MLSSLEEPKHYVVTGGCGFIGSHLTRRLLTHGHTVTVIDDLSTGCHENIPPTAELIVADINDTRTLSDVFATADGCFHLAARSRSSDLYADWFAFQHSNVSGSISVFQAARRGRYGFPIPVVYASSASIYGNADGAGVRLSEIEMPPHPPISIYAASKLACEEYARIAANAYGVPSIGARIFNVYGSHAYQTPAHAGVVLQFLDAIANDTMLMIDGDGKQVRDFVYIDDCVTGLLAAMNGIKSKPDVVNICTGVPTSILQLVQTLEQFVGHGLERHHRPPRPTDIRYSVGDPAVAKGRLGVGCSISLADGLGQMMSDSRGIETPGLVAKLADTIRCSQ